MKTLVKSALAAIALTMIGGAALAADACCCKDMDCKMPCCDKKAEGAPTTPAPEHQH